MKPDNIKRVYSNDNIGRMKFTAVRIVEETGVNVGHRVEEVVIACFELAE